MKMNTEHVKFREHNEGSSKRKADSTSAHIETTTKTWKSSLIRMNGTLENSRRATRNNSHAPRPGLPG